MFPNFHLLVFVLTGITLVSCGPLNAPNELSDSKRYDFVVVGGGTAGCVIANRLTENGNFNVLLVEAGPDYDANNDDLNVPFFAGHLMDSKVNWNYTTVPQPGADNRKLPVSRGFVLGGSSSINFMGWYRGSNDLWDHFARLSGDDVWSWKSMEAYYRKIATLVPPQDGRDITGDADPSAHGDGPIKITLPGFPFKFDSYIAEASQVLGEFNRDYNSGNTLGISWGQFTTGGGERNSAVNAYIRPAIDRPNLDILVNTRATKLFSFSGEGEEPHTNIVELTYESDRTHSTNITATREVILSGGSINSPQLLLLSGIGPKSDLEALDIPVIVDSPAVGRNLAEHPLVFTTYAVNTDSFDEITRNASLQDVFLREWMEKRTGPLVNPPLSMVGNFKLPEELGLQDPSSGPESANIMFYIGDGMILPPPPTGNFLSIAAAVVSPTSRGRLTLASSSPWDHPLIDYNMYSTEYDIRAQVEGIKMVDKFVSRIREHAIVEASLYGDLNDAETDEEKAQWAMENVIPYFHPVGTISMGRDGAVDSRLRLKGVKGVRVVDASVFPQIPECNTQAPVYMLAERAANLILEEYDVRAEEGSGLHEEL